MTFQSADPADDRVLRAILLTLIGFAAFSSGDAVAKWVVGQDGLPPTQVTFFYGIFAFIPVAIHLALTRGFAQMRPRTPGLTLLRGLLGFLAGLGIITALGRLPLADAYAIVFSGPIVVTVLAIPLLGDRIGPWRAAAVLVGFGGVLVMLRPGFSALDIGHLVALGSTVLFALSVIVLRRIGRREADAALLGATLGITILGSALTLPFVWVPPSAAQLAAMVLGGALWGTGNVFIILAMRNASPSRVMPFQYSQMLWGVFYGTLIFGDGLDPWMMLGAAIVIASGLFILWRETVRARADWIAPG